MLLYPIWVRLSNEILKNSGILKKIGLFAKKLLSFREHMRYNEFEIRVNPDRIGFLF